MAKVQKNEQEHIENIISIVLLFIFNGLLASVVIGIEIGHPYLIASVVYLLEFIFVVYEIKHRRHNVLDNLNQEPKNTDIKQ